MEKTDITETVIRRTRLRDLLEPLSIFSTESDEPIRPDWVGINHTVLSNHHRTGETEGYNLAFYRDNGELLEYLQFDTLEIALDQAKTIVGIQPSEWRGCNVSVPSDGRVPWESAV